jgi:hypothetical protein
MTVTIGRRELLAALGGAAAERRHGRVGAAGPVEHAFTSASLRG